MKRHTSKTPATPYILVMAIYRRLLSHNRDKRPVYFVWFSAAILAATTLFWANLGAAVQQYNADQLASAFLFEHAQAFHAAIFPAAHTFLLKWPLFFVMQLAGLTPQTFRIATIGLSLVTVAGIAVLLSRIERRPLPLGCILLALACVLLLVPAQPYPGGILPVSFAMVTTRNVEYLVYILALVGLARNQRIKSWSFVGVTLLLTVLGMSDQLFLDISAGGAFALLAIVVISRSHTWWRLARTWMLTTIVATIISALGISLMHGLHVTQISTQSGLGPYGFVHDGQTLALGLVYTVLDTLTNFGANPAASIAVLRTIPHEAVQGMRSIGVLTYVINFIIAIVALAALVMHVPTAFRRSSKDHGHAARLAIMLIMTSAASIGLFMLTKHYYPVDGRYLTIIVLTAFVCLALYGRTRTWPQRYGWLCAAVLCIGIVAGLVPALNTYKAEQAAMRTVNYRNRLVNAALTRHRVDVLVGDYWRVVPIKLSKPAVRYVSPLAGCTEPSRVLATPDLQPSLRNHSFAYLISFDKSLTGYPSCDIATVIKKYGRPNSSVLIAGTYAHPTEQLLFYDRGIMPPNPSVVAAPGPVATVTPIGLDALPHTTCTQRTVMNIVAHQDDDLLFINPNTMRSIANGDCVRTVYITAGDAGVGDYFWLSREKGAEAAYSVMMHSDAPWVQRIIQLPAGQYITVATARQMPNVSLIFLHLPDGNLTGRGFPATNSESIERLYDQRISSVHTVDKQSTYTSSELTKALVDLIQTYKPQAIRTQSTQSGYGTKDHSDHMTVGRYATVAYSLLDETLQSDTSFEYYQGYSIRTRPTNISSDELRTKEEVFFAYGAFDGSVCHTFQECSKPSNNYTAYLRRQYISEH